MTTRPVPMPADMLCFAVYAAAHAFTRAYRPLLAPHGLTYPQYLVLTLLWTHDGSSVTEIGAPLHLDSGTLTPLLHRLEAAGLIRRTRDERDARLVRVWLTEEGRAMETTLTDVPAAIGCAVGLAAGDLRALTDRVHELGRTLRATAGSGAAAAAGTGDRDE